MSQTETVDGHDSMHETMFKIMHETGQPQPAFKKLGRATTAAFATGILLLAGCSGATKTPETIVSVQAVTARQGAIPVVVSGEALLAPLHQAVLAAKISAPVQHFYVQRGDKVHKGELLAVLENKDLSGAALGSQGQYQQAQAQYQTVTQSTVPQEMQKAEHDVAQAKAEVDLQQSIYTSQQKLFAEGALPGRTVDQTKVALTQAKTQYGILLRSFEALKKVNRTAELATATGQLHQAQGQYQQAKATLGYTEIRSPIDGYVTERPLYPGEMANAGAPILTVMDTSVMIAKSHLPQAQVQGMALDAPAQVTVPGIPNPVPGKVTLISPALDPSSTTVEVWVRLENKDNQLKPGTAVQVAITARTISNALLVPTVAIVENPSGGTHLMVIGADSIAHQREVKIGAQDNGETQILSGIRAGEQIITVGAYALEDGTKVRVVPASTGGSAN
jgi:HlyD family secretion protein